MFTKNIFGERLVETFRVLWMLKNFPFTTHRYVGRNTFSINVCAATVYGQFFLPT